MSTPSTGTRDPPLRFRKFGDRDTSPERHKVWTEPRPKGERKVPVVYYLSKNGHLEHPHFMEVSLSSPEGLYLRDVVNRLNSLRGKGMASMYSWSSKRSYRNGYVWHDLCENDFIYPAHGQEYVLKGSELVESTVRSFFQATSGSSPGKTFEHPKAFDEREICSVRSRALPWNRLDRAECAVYRSMPAPETASRGEAISIYADEKGCRGTRIYKDEESEKEIKQDHEHEVAVSRETELSRDDISPPSSSSSPETIDCKTDGCENRTINAGAIHGRIDDDHPSGRFKASTVLMQLISCGSISVKDHGLSLISHYRARLPRVVLDRSPKERDGVMANPSFRHNIVEDKQYFSGSIIETNKGNGEPEEFQGLRRSASYDADRGSSLGLAEIEVVASHPKCIPRRPKKSLAAKESKTNFPKCTL